MNDAITLDEVRQSYPVWAMANVQACLNFATCLMARNYIHGGLGRLRIMPARFPLYADMALLALRGHPLDRLRVWIRRRTE